MVTFEIPKFLYPFVFFVLFILEFMLNLYFFVVWSYGLNFMGSVEFLSYFQAD